MLFDEVKAAISPEDVLNQFGHDGKHFAGGTRYRICPVCGAEANNVFSVRGETCHCFQCSFSGSVIDLFAALSGLSAVDAAKRLADDNGLSDPALAAKAVEEAEQRRLRKKEADAKRKAALAIALERLARLCATPTGDALKARDYLTRQRQIPLEVVLEAERRGLVGYLPSNPLRAQALLERTVGKEVLIEAGLMREGHRSPLAYRPLVFFLPRNSGIEARLIREQRDKDEPKSIRYGELVAPYWWQGSNQGVVVVEGAIDMLSIVALGSKRSVMALPGCEAFHADWIATVVDRKGCARFLVALDADDAGEKASVKVSSACCAAGVTSQRLAPLQKDWNDVLRHRVSVSLQKAA